MIGILLEKPGEDADGNKRSCTIIRADEVYLGHLFPDREDDLVAALDSRQLEAS